MDKQLEKLAKILHSEVGEIKSFKNGLNKFDGYVKMPKTYSTWTDFVRHVWKLYKEESQKTYKGVSIDFIIEYARKYKAKECKTILKQININGQTDEIIIRGKRQAEIIFSKDVGASE